VSPAKRTARGFRIRRRIRDVVYVLWGRETVWEVPDCIESAAGRIDEKSGTLQSRDQMRQREPCIGAISRVGKGGGIGGRKIEDSIDNDLGADIRHVVLRGSTKLSFPGYQKSTILEEEPFECEVDHTS
jgi:hypothetical protein